MLWDQTAENDCYKSMEYLCNSNIKKGTAANGRIRHGSIGREEVNFSRGTLASKRGIDGDGRRVRREF